MEVMQRLPSIGIKAAWRRAAPLALVLYGMLLALEIVPELHRLLHDDCGGAQHQCAVTALLQGQLDLAAPAAACLPTTLGFLLPPPRAQAGPSFRFHLFSLGRAPPRGR